MLGQFPDVHKAGSHQPSLTRPTVLSGFLSYQVKAVSYVVRHKTRLALSDWVEKFPQRNCVLWTFIVPESIWRPSVATEQPLSYRYGVAELLDSLFQLLSLQFQLRTPLHQLLFLLFFSYQTESMCQRCLAAAE